MKIVLEANPLALRQKTGVAYFIEALAQSLLKQTQNSGDEIILWGPDLESDPLPQWTQKTLWRGGMPREGRAILWSYFQSGGVPAEIDIYHLPFLAPPAPYGAKTRLVTTIYDLAFMHFPDIAPSPAIFRHQVECSALQASQSDHVFTISQATKSDIVAAFGVSEEKISVVYPGLQIETPQENDESGRAAFEALQLPSRYVLCVGTWEPRKNLPLLLRAWAKLRPPDVTLAVCGVKGWKFESSETLLDELQLHDSVRPLGYVAREAMPHLYANAQCLVFPSLYEGFGLPVVEAMKCGCPVLCSDSSSLPEAGGEAVWLLPPRDGEAWAEALQKLLGDATLRETMRQKGQRQAAKFSWDEAARQTLQTYRSLL
ncbi:MAG TPA: glycosyltransferase family 1 protein [Abditibacteriaceae bacterium]